MWENGTWARKTGTRKPRVLIIISAVISRDIPQGNWLHLAKRAKEHVKIPIQMAYRLFTPDRPDKAIAEGGLDFWEMCRSMIADPYMPKKVLDAWEKAKKDIAAAKAKYGPVIEPGAFKGI